MCYGARMNRLLIASTLAISACGSPSPDVFGTYSGSTTVCTAGTSDCGVLSSTRIRLAESGDSVLVSEFCPDGSGAMLVPAFSGQFSWVGNVQCAWPPGPLCSTSVVRYSSARGEVTGNRLALVVDGVVTGCGYTVATTTTFAGVR